MSEESRERIANGLRSLVLVELAHIDNRGDLAVKLPFKHGPINGIVAIDKGGTIEVADLV